MALRFMAMLVRKKVGSATLGGIDLPGFVRQIDKLLDDARHEHDRPHPHRAAVPPLLRDRIASRVSRARSATGSSPIAGRRVHRVRRRAGRAPRSPAHVVARCCATSIGIQRAVVGAGQLSKHKASVQSSSRATSARQVDVRFELGTAEVTTEILAAIDAAVAPPVRNAIDHGIELAAARSAAGKPRDRHASDCAAAARRAASCVTVEDDGRGIDFDRVRARALELGLVTAVTADRSIASGSSI